MKTKKSKFDGNPQDSANHDKAVAIGSKLGRMMRQNEKDLDPEEDDTEKSMNASDVLNDYLEKSGAPGMKKVTKRVEAIDTAREIEVDDEATDPVKEKKPYKFQTTLAAKSLEKAEGEGTRGGKIIGHTKSGKPIYGTGHATYSTPAKQPGYNGPVKPARAASGHKMLRDRLPEYSKQDHQDAAEAHGKLAVEHADKHAAMVSKQEKKHGLSPFRPGQISGGVDPAFGEKTNDKIRDHVHAANDHADAERLHLRAAKLVKNPTEKAMKSSASDVLSDFLSKSRTGWSGGLPTIEPTGATLYDDDESVNGGPFPARDANGSAQTTGDSKYTSFPDDADQPVLDNPSDWKEVQRANLAAVKRDNAKREANTKRLATTKNTDKNLRRSMPDNYTQQELNHTVARERAMYQAQHEYAASGGPGVVVGRGVRSPDAPQAPLVKSYVEQRGMVTYVHGGVDERASNLIKSNDFYVGGRAPSLCHGALGEAALCKSCGAGHAAMLTCCPSCGDGAVFQKSNMGDVINRPLQKSAVYAPTLSLSDEG